MNGIKPITSVEIKCERAESRNRSDCVKHQRRSALIVNGMPSGWKHFNNGAFGNCVIDAVQCKNSTSLDKNK